MNVQVAIKILVDKFAVLRVENRLLNMFPEMFSSDLVMDFDESLTKNIAVETEDLRNERVCVTRKLESLKKRLKILNRLGHYQHFREVDSIFTSQSKNGSGLPEKEDEINVDTPAAFTSTSENIFGEEKLPVREKVGGLTIEISDAQEPPLSLSLFE